MFGRHNRRPLTFDDISESATLFRVGSRGPAWLLNGYAEEFSGNELLMPEGAWSFRRCKRERASGTRLSASAPLCAPALPCSTISYPVRRSTHLWSLGLRSRLRKRLVGTEQSVTILNCRPASDCQTYATLQRTSMHLHSVGSLLGLDFETR